MKKISLVITMVLCVLLTGCSSDEKDSKRSSNNSSTNSPANNNSSSNNNNQSQSGAAGFDMDTLANELELANKISGNPENLDLSGIGVKEARLYGNILLVFFDIDNNSGWYDVYNAGKASINGQEILMGGAVGPYMIFFMDNNIDQDAVRIFQRAGGYIA